MSLAAKYDSAPEIQDVSITGCMTVYAEPLIRETSSALTVQRPRRCRLHSGG